MTISTNPTTAGDGSPHAEPVQRLSDLSERAMSELEQHIAGLPVNAKRIRGTLGLAGVTGQVTSAGAITAGTGFTVSHTGTGAYTITFSPAFAAAPTVVGTVVDGANARVFGISTVSASSVAVTTRGGGGAAADLAFHFVAFATV